MIFFTSKYGIFRTFGKISMIFKQLLKILFIFRYERLVKKNCQFLPDNLTIMPDFGVIEKMNVKFIISTQS